MFLRKTTFLFLILFTINIVVIAQNRALSKIDKEDMKRHLTFISSDSLQGRSLGTEVDGLGITADYIAETLKKLGVKPGGENYFQKVELMSSKPDIENTYLEIISNNEELIFKTDLVLNLQRNIPNLEFGGDIVFAGFGWEDENSGYDDFKGIDLKDKIVVISVGTPQLFKKQEIYRWNNKLETLKKERAFNSGAAGVILVNSPNDAKNKNSSFNKVSNYINRAGYTIKSKENLGNEKGYVFVLSKAADKILGGSGKYDKYLSEIAKKKKPNSFLMESVKSKINVLRSEEPIEAKNVIGIVEGSHPELKNEYVIFVAHYDHLGIGNDGDIYNGADDNGSGTVTLMELAEAFSSLEKKSKRSLVFLWVTCEEIGLLGSRYYTENPIFPLEKTVACINIDMDGRVYEPRDSKWNKSPKTVKDFNGLYTLSNNVWTELSEISDAKCAELSIIPDNSLPSYFLRSSDHYYFHEKGIPVLNYSTGYHADYHKVGDEISKINFDKMKLVTDLCFFVGYEIANREKIVRNK